MDLSGVEERERGPCLSARWRPTATCCGRAGASQRFSGQPACSRRGARARVMHECECTRTGRSSPRGPSVLLNKRVTGSNEPRLIRLPKSVHDAAAAAETLGELERAEWRPAAALGTSAEAAWTLCSIELVQRCISFRILSCYFPGNCHSGATLVSYVARPAAPYSPDSGRLCRVASRLTRSDVYERAIHNARRTLRGPPALTTTSAMRTRTKSQQARKMRFAF